MPGPSARGEEARAALALLESIPARGRAPKTGYRRDEFGRGWKDPDRNGCDSRNDILRRDLAATVVRADGCVVVSGILTDPYTGAVVEFVRGRDTSQRVQIDHVVPLSDAWQKGAQSWSAERRMEFANDPEELLAVSGAVNSAKGSGDAATWLPPNKQYRCEYTARQTRVKARYGLWMTPAEQDAIRRVLASC
ncbi:HNH endonuclease family protein [Falsarthrobacter nasiphocae]|uniref:GmrSD restriction endonucleases C-terminal domain-containing protein n=1 Tax=Falsarthrobacter nasiphocae TaxID=189863 RepID=A0AAE3YG91_9MICC|nr:HNH endonuclease family protein [Falsarthrobacter nasiphocae]MDR6892605.1 hypothetical protein [Falsarthrobacter nasiphocae]